MRRVIVRRSPVHGKGVFAMRPLAVGQSQANWLCRDKVARRESYVMVRIPYMTN
jgi:hypothetical protein